MALYYEGDGPSDVDVERLPARFPSIPDEQYTEENEDEIIFYEQLRTETFQVADQIMNYVPHSDDKVIAIMKLTEALDFARKAIVTS